MDHARAEFLWGPAEKGDPVFPHHAWAAQGFSRAVGWLAGRSATYGPPRRGAPLRPFLGYARQACRALSRLARPRQVPNARVSHSNDRQPGAGYRQLAGGAAAVTLAQRVATSRRSPRCVPRCGHAAAASAFASRRVSVALTRALCAAAAAASAAAFALPFGEASGMANGMANGMTDPEQPLPAEQKAEPQQPVDPGLAGTPTGRSSGS